MQAVRARLRQLWSVPTLLLHFVRIWGGDGCGLVLNIGGLRAAPVTCLGLYSTLYKFWAVQGFSCTTYWIPWVLTPLDVEVTAYDFSLLCGSDLAS